MYYNYDFLEVGKSCTEKFNKSFSYIGICTTNIFGNNLQHREAKRIAPLNHKYVPWIVINGIHNDTLQNDAQMDLEKLINAMCS